MSQLVLSPVCLPGPVLTCLSTCLPVHLQAGLPTVLPSGHGDLPLLEDPRVPGGQQGPQALGLLQGELIGPTDRCRTHPPSALRVTSLWACPGAAEGPIGRGHRQGRVCEGGRFTWSLLLRHRSQGF